MRRIFSIVLLLVLALPEVTPLYAFVFTPAHVAESQLPACCRRNGKHHCMMSMAERGRMASRVRLVSTPPEQCPFCPPALVVTAQGPLFAPPPAGTGTAILLSCTILPARTLDRPHSGPGHAHSTRGPPQLFA